MKRTTRYQPTEIDEEHRAAMSLRRTQEIANSELRFRLALIGQSPTEAELHAAEAEAAERWHRMRQAAAA